MSCSTLSYTDNTAQAYGPTNHNSLVFWVRFPVFCRICKLAFISYFLTHILPALSMQGARLLGRYKPNRCTHGSPKSKLRMKGDGLKSHHGRCRLDCRNNFVEGAVQCWHREQWVTISGSTHDVALGDGLGSDCVILEVCSSRTTPRFHNKYEARR